MFLLAGLAGTLEAESGRVRVPALDGKSHVWEAEAGCLGRRTGGVRWRLVEDDSASGGVWMLFYGEKPGDFIELTLPDVLPGRYVLHLRYKANPERGICQVSLGEADGSSQVAVGDPVDLYREEGWLTTEIGLYRVLFAILNPLDLQECGLPLRAAPVTLEPIHRVRLDGDRPSNLAIRTASIRDDIDAQRLHHFRMFGLGGIDRHLLPNVAKSTESFD